MGKHKEWRKLAKKIRRKKIRSILAQKREAEEKEEEEKRKMSPTYEKRIAEEKTIIIATKEAELKEFEEKLRKWEAEEERVREETKFREAQIKEKEEKIEKERKEKIEADEVRAKEEEEKKRRIQDALYNFAAGITDELPNDILAPTESNPGAEVCPFFHKVAACKFRELCSRNHVRPSVSKNLLFPGFYLHFSIAQLGQGEYDTDMSLEFDEKEIYAHFLEFYQDIRSEFEKFGRLTHLFVCTNHEPHLRGNVYASFFTEKEAMTAFLKFNGRYYAGRVITCQFVNIPSWKTAICGLYFKQKCPKGDACNFLHVFKDPGPPFYQPVQERSSSDEWRWSTSPPDRTTGHEVTENLRKKNDNRKRSKSRKSHKDRSSERQSDSYKKSLHISSRSSEDKRGSCSSRSFKREHESNKRYTNEFCGRSGSNCKNFRNSDRRSRNDSDYKKSHTKRIRRSRSPRRNKDRKIKNGGIRDDEGNKSKYKPRRYNTSCSSSTDSEVSDNESCDIETTSKNGEMMDQ